MNNKIDVLVIAAHPDDAELFCGGTILSHVAQGKKVAVLDLTRGELGSRGTVETRTSEANKAAGILGLSFRENLGFADGFFQNDREHQLQIVRKIREHRPELILTNAVRDRHPDHGKAAQLVVDACFLSGLIKVETEWGGKMQEPWRPAHIYHFIQTDYIKPDFIVDISKFFEKKIEAVSAYKTQFFSPDYNSDEPQTLISSPEYMKFLEGRAREFGQAVRVEYGEGFTKVRDLGVSSLFDLI